MLISDKGGTIELHRGVPGLLHANAVRGQDWKDVCGRMAFHHIPPMIFAVLRKNGLGANRRWINDEFRPFKSEDARGLRKPLIPANRDAQTSKRGIKNHESRVTGGEIEFLFVAFPSWDMALSINP